MVHLQVGRSSSRGLCGSGSGGGGGASGHRAEATQEALVDLADRLCGKALAAFALFRCGRVADLPAALPARRRLPARPTVICTAAEVIVQAASGAEAGRRQSA